MKILYQYMKKKQYLPNTNNRSKNSSRKPHSTTFSNTRSQSPYSNSFRGGSQDRQNSPYSAQNQNSISIFKTIKTETITLYRILTE